MNQSYPKAIFAASLVLALCPRCHGMAQALTLFRSESQAQRHCPADTIVWLDLRKGRYYTKGQKRYATGYSGSFVCRSLIPRSSYRRSLLGLR
jgi:hypothetical protein